MNLTTPMNCFQYTIWVQTEGRPSDMYLPLYGEVLVLPSVRLSMIGKILSLPLVPFHSSLPVCKVTNVVGRFVTIPSGFKDRVLSCRHVVSFLRSHPMIVGGTTLHLPDFLSVESIKGPDPPLVIRRKMPRTPYLFTLPFI